METKDTWIQVRISPEEKEKVLELSRKLGKATSEIVREELQDRIAKEAMTKPRKAVAK